MRRPLVLLLFAAIFVAELGWSGVAPLIPDYQEIYGLTETRAGLVFTFASVGILLTSLPAGALSRRFAVRTMTLWGMVSITVGNVLLAVAARFGVILLGRVFFGVGLGTMYVAGTAWLHDAAEEHAPQALAMTTAVVGLGALLGPAFSGFLADRLSLGAPFWAMGACSALMVVALLVAPTEVGRRAEPSPPLADMLRAMGADVLMVTSVILTLAVSMMWMTTDLLVPIRLNDHGYSSTGIGVALSAASIAFIGASAITARRAERYSTIRFSAAWTIAMAGGISIAALSSSIPATLAFLVVAGASSGVLIALTYPLGVVGARRGHFSIAVVGALLNMVWAGAGLVGPAAGGAISELIGDRAAFFVLTLIAVASTGWMWLRRNAADAGREPKSLLDSEGPVV